MKLSSEGGGVKTTTSDKESMAENSEDGKQRGTASRTDTSINSESNIIFINYFASNDMTRTKKIREEHKQRIQKEIIKHLQLLSITQRHCDI